MFTAIEAVARRGGNVDIRDACGRTPLWFAINHNRHRAVKALLRANCFTGQTADSELVCWLNGYHFAYYSVGKYEFIADELVASPLQLALDKELLGIAKLLVLAGAPVQPLYKWLQNFDSNKRQRFFTESVELANQFEMTLLISEKRRDPTGAGCSRSRRVRAVTRNSKRKTRTSGSRFVPSHLLSRCQ